MVKHTQVQVGGDETFLEKYGLWIALGLAVVAVGATFWYMKREQDEIERRAHQDTLEFRTRAEEYAEEKAQWLLNKRLKEQPGVRHDVSDPGIAEDLSATHDWETNVHQRSTPSHQPVTSDLNQIATNEGEQEPRCSEIEDEGINL